jgi:acetyl esterase/lipase
MLRLLAFSLFAFMSAARATGYTVERDVIYTPSGWPEALRADLYQPQTTNGLRPAVLLVHGGGWRSRSRSDMNGIARRLAARGFVVMNVSYRFAPAHRFPAQVHDLQVALRWLRANAARYEIDSARIGGFGYSAGAHLVMLVGLLGPADELDRPHGGEAARLQAVVAGGTPTDLRKFPGGTMVPEFLGATQQQDARPFAAASPVLYATPGDPPVFLYHGGSDSLVPPDHAEDMKRALDRAGVRAELRLVSGYGHVGLFLFGTAVENEGIAFLETSFAYCSKTSCAVPIAPSANPPSQ